MKIGLLGSGAMGCLFGGQLAAAGQDVFLMDADPITVEAIRKNGLQIERDGATTSSRPTIYGPNDPIKAADLLIVLVKATRTAQALESFHHAITKHTMILCLQNGLGNLETIHNTVPNNTLIAGTTAQGSNLLAPGRILHTGRGQTVIGPYSKVSQKDLVQIAAVLSLAGIETTVNQDVDRLIWQKLMANAAINPLTALLGVPNGYLPQNPEAMKAVRAILSEAVQVALSQGQNFDLETTIRQSMDIAQNTARNQSSMLQDILAGRETEVRSINGAIATLGESAGILVPINRLLCQLIKAREQAHPDQP